MRLYCWPRKSLFHRIIGANVINEIWLLWNVFCIRNVWADLILFLISFTRFDEISLTPSYIMLKIGQACVNAARFLKYVYPFYNIYERVEYVWILWTQNRLNVSELQRCLELTLDKFWLKIATWTQTFSFYGL